MTFTEFKNIVENFQQYLNKCSELYREGINIHNSDLYKPIVSAFYDLFESKFDEDRRNTLHCGVDTIAILRAIKVRAFKKVYQGASTIEQQFVRVVSNRYEKSFYRKFREQLLAIAVSKRRTKREISNAYLSIAYYGYNLEGITAIKKICGENIKEIDLNRAIELVSRLKYPQPRNIDDNWLEKHINRNKYILEKIKQD